MDQMWILIQTDQTADGLPIDYILCGGPKIWS